MNKVLVVLLLLMQLRSGAQALEVQQLLLNVEKLAQFKSILEDMKKGYEILSAGYNTIKNISQGNFNLHETFLNGLLEVSPVVRKYKRVADIISLQVRLVKEYKAAFNRFRDGGQFSVNEIKSIARTYDRLIDASVKSMDDLLTVITTGRLRMSDAERLAAIDQVYKGMETKMKFLRQFNESNSILAMQRKLEQNDVDVMRRIYGVK